MTIEERLQEYILSRYRSLREFAMSIDMSPSTLDSMLKRGLDRATIGSVIKVCKALNISVDELANGRIISTLSVMRPDETDVILMLQRIRGDIIARDDLTIDGRPLNNIERAIITNLIDAIISYDFDNRIQSDIYNAQIDRFKRYYDQREAEIQSQKDNKNHNKN